MKSYNKVKITIKKKFKLYFYKYSISVLYIISYYIYYLSLERCLDGEEICGNNMKWIYTKVVELVIASELISVLFALMIFNISTKFHLVHLIVVFVLFYYYSHDFYFFNHGMYNIIVFILLFSLNLIIILFLKLLIYLFNLKNKLIINKIILIIILFIIYNFEIPDFTCDNWEKGLNNTSIDNDKDKYGCIIVTPKYCQYKLFSPYQDYTKILDLNCSLKNSNYRKKILEKSDSPYITKETKRFGYPLTNKGLMALLDGLDDKVLKKYVADNLFDLDNNYKNFTESEITVDFSKDPLGELIIDLKYNESLSKERKKLEYLNNPYSNNILILFLDSVGRAASLRQLNKTLSFFEKFISYEGGFNQNFPEQKFHSFQFFKYQSFKGRTSGNFPRIYYGNVREAKNITSITKYFKENGFITNYVCDICKKDNARTLHNMTFSELYDHQMLLCDTNSPRYSKPIRKCFYGKDNIAFLLEYSEQFWRKYQNNRKFSNIIINTAHEGTMEVLKYVDEIIYNHLYSLYNDNLLKDSSIFLLSDHGVGVESIYYAFKFFALEAELPMLYIIINDRKNVTYKEQYFNIHKNQQTFITAYDIYNTINHLLYGDKYKYIQNLTDENPTPKSPLGISLFEYINAKDRKSKDYEYMKHNICK